ncbi:hypothetical protein CRD60_02105 [Bifidobacterium aemilianum]|uniref:Uncharacterized protein n=1 Tax=Bifidobacterium aemilianum TaxID=2493120 RepID=A0A366K8F0_9BIFI|nr:hypothetical protein [Bifidobacterium aemilianum]RBP97996.1 hypothetical protein CRD60_02105 [Bifidobacterium aemilianum]
MDIIIVVATGLVGLVIGAVFGGLPLKTSMMTEQQNKAQQLLGILAAGLMIVLILSGKDLGSWVIIICLVLGLGLAKIPPVHRLLLNRIAFLRPDSEAGQGRARQAQGDLPPERPTTGPPSRPTASRWKRNPTHRKSNPRVH